MLQRPNAAMVPPSRRLFELRPTGVPVKGVQKMANVLALRNPTLNPDVLPPPPPEDDDLLSHYACPQNNFEPLPYDLFPRPSAEQEKFEAACFPFFKYYDLKKYSLEEARRYSAMDLIPKDGLKIMQEAPQRNKRLKRTTAESSQIAGFYRNKNEGVEITNYTNYGRKPAVTKQMDGNKGWLRWKKQQDESESVSTRSSGSLFKSIMLAPRLPEGRENWSTSSESTMTASGTKITMTVGKESSVSGTAGETFRSKRIFQVEQRSFTDAKLEDDDPLLAIPPKLPTSFYPSKLSPAVRTGPKPIPPAKRSAQIKSIPNPINVRSMQTVRTKPVSKPKPPNRAPGMPSVQNRSTPSLLDTSSSMDEDKLAAEELGVIANEELGASDDEEPGYSGRFF